ncbi:phosphoglycolate phosphatase [Palleronia sp. LCG004]|uniref:phosphoglycolate phosphatase n=1 Tax=Palleronia sp. LCG004 TaxID=3079304 RepID=UPI002942DB9E|nr:phosphoglycolate phosphatase [Palleronia sp. LCG004]WOI55606.1 phosphoglycolate phosphatase [Palleronia sp. LCG004]
MGTIIFDLDGTLIDSAPDIHATLNRALGPLGVPELSLERVRGFIGRGAPVLVRRACDALDVPPDARDEVLERFLARYENAVELTQPYDQAFEALDAVRARGHRLGLCTNKPIAATQYVLEHFDLARRLDAVIGGDSLAVKKPDPAPLRMAMSALGAEHCLYVGDSETDCETAENAGMPFALFTRGYRKTAPEGLPNRAAFDDWSDFPAIAETIISE